MAKVDVSDAVLKLFAEQACTLSITAERVSIQCDTRDEAELLYAFLASLCVPRAATEQMNADEQAENDRWRTAQATADFLNQPVIYSQE